MQNKRRNLLGLGTVDARVLETLAAGSFSVSMLSREVNSPKTTLNYVIKRLFSRGLIVKVPKGKRTWWTLQDPNKLQDQLIDIGEEFYPKRTSGVTTIPISKDTRIAIYRGAKSLYQLWQKFTSLSKLERLYSVQPDTSFNAAVSHIINELSYETLVELNDEIRSSKIVVEGIVHEHSADTISQTIASANRDPKKFLSGFIGRLADTAKLPRDFMDVSAEMYIHGNTFTIIHWDDEVAVSITNKAVATFFKEMFETLKYFCNKYDQNERIAKKLVELASSAG